MTFNKSQDETVITSLEPALCRLWVSIHQIKFRGKQRHRLALQSINQMVSENSSKTRRPVISITAACMVVAIWFFSHGLFRAESVPKPRCIVVPRVFQARRAPSKAHNSAATLMETHLTTVRSSCCTSKPITSAQRLAELAVARDVRKERSRYKCPRRFVFIIVVEYRVKKNVPE